MNNIKFNDIFAVIVILVTATLFALNKWVQLPEIVIGALITPWALIIQHYFRKKQGET